MDQVLMLMVVGMILVAIFGRRWSGEGGGGYGGGFGGDGDGGGGGGDGGGD